MIPTRQPNEQEVTALRKHLQPTPALNLAEAVTVVKSMREAGVTVPVEVNLKPGITPVQLDNALNVAGVVSTTIKKDES
jgi:hypothetical protein